jgi:ATP-dependent exoDNAse (exonuclease V) alpha subunit
MKPNIKFILSGDFKQLSPVNDVYKLGNYENSPALVELCDGNRLTLSKCRRSDDVEFYKLCQGDMNLIPKSKFGNSLCLVNLVFTNKKRKEINDTKMKEVVKAHEEINQEIELKNIKMKKNKNKDKKGLFIPKRLFDEQSQDVILFDGMPIIARKTFQPSKDLKISNNQTFIISSIKKGIIYIYDNTNTFEIKQEEFQKYFLVAYAMTIHKSQGSSFNFPYTIHEWEKLDDKLKFVALTRTTNPSFINII